MEQPTEFLSRLRDVDVTMTEWRRQLGIYRNPGGASLVERGFATFFLNRCNRSGIVINGGPIGGVAQAGKWRLDARFNKPVLLRRCEKVAAHRDRIDVSGLDGVDFLDRRAGGETM